MLNLYFLINHYMELSLVLSLNNNILIYCLLHHPIFVILLFQISTLIFSNDLTYISILFFFKFELKNSICVVFIYSTFIPSSFSTPHALPTIVSMDLSPKLQVANWIVIYNLLASIFCYFNLSLDISNMTTCIYWPY